jgi:hypothetical protein
VVAVEAVVAVVVVEVVVVVVVVVVVAVVLVEIGGYNILKLKNFSENLLYDCAKYVFYYL